MSRLSRTFWLVTAGAAACLSAHAQTPEAATPPEATVVTQAEDAFGEQLGVDRVGLYNEVQVRGFDLQQSGAYRIEDHYFARATGLSESLTGGMSVRVGASAAALSLPSPSGVVVYRLREADRTGLELSAGLRDFETVHTEAEAAWINADGTFGVTATVIAQPFSRPSTGQEGTVYDAGAVLGWSPASGHRMRLFGGHQERDYDGDFSINPVSGREPPPLPRLRNYAPEWAKSAFRESNAGVLYDGRAGDWTFAASLTWSRFGAERSDTAVLDVDSDGDAVRTIYVKPPVASTATAAEVKATRGFTTGALRHEISLAIRGRHTQTDLADPAAFDGGQFNIADYPPHTATPVLPAEHVFGRDHADQAMASLTYNLQWPQHLDLRLGAHRSQYDKETRQPDGLTSERTQENWLYNASAVVPVSTNLRLFASYVTGLEESGVAPATAVNRGDVLPPVEAKQWEAGLSWDVRPDLSFIAAYFDITKPIAGLRNDGRYDFVGDVRHAGYELSLSGRVTPDTSVVLGAVLLQPRLSGQLVDSGQSQKVPAGVSRTNITVNVEHQFSNGWSADGQLLFEGSRRMTGNSQTEVPGVTFLTLGARYSFTAAGRPVTARLQAVNVLDDQGYYATPSSALAPVWSRTYRVLFSTAF